MLYSIIYLSLILAPTSNMGQMKMNLEVKGEDYSIYAKTKIVELKNLRASEIEPFIRARLSQYGAVQINDALNMLIITDREPKLTDVATKIEEAKRILSLIDIPPKQVMVEGQVIEMDDNYARSLGLDIFGIIKSLHPGIGVNRSQHTNKSTHTYDTGNTVTDKYKDVSTDINGRIRLDNSIVDLIKQGFSNGKGW